MIGYFRFALVVLLLAGIAGVSAIITMQFAVHGEEVRVPDLQGMTVDAATGKAAAAGLDLSVTERLYSTVLPAGRILLQTPAPGATVRRGWDLAAAESLGPQRIAIPDLRGKPEHDAILLLRQKGLEIGAVAHLPDARVAAGTVLAQDPGPEARGAERPSVSLLVAEEEPEETPAVVMPDEVGRSLPEARADLEKAGLHPETALGAPNGTQVTLSPATQPGTVIAQTPPDGAKADAHTRVILWTPAGAAASPDTSAAAPR